MSPEGTHDQNLRTGFVALVGRPNAGKSTLINAVMGEKLLITSSTPQTTRHRIRAILNRDDAQMVLIDTPGLHKPYDALGEELNKSALKALDDVDVVAFVLDASKAFGKGDAWVTQAFKKVKAHKLLVVTKADLVSQEDIERQIARAKGTASFDDVIVVSARDDFNVEGFVAAAVSQLPVGPLWFPRDMDTDQSLEVMIAEFIREKILRTTHDEVPHAIGVQVETVEYEKKRNLYKIYAYIYVERDSQKGIIVGKGGEMIKRIGTQARGDLSRLLGADIYLDLRVKVKKDWRRDASQIRRFGYGDGA